jgi:hypothetical protein
MRSIGNYEYVPFKHLDVDEGKVLVSATPCNLGWYHITNRATTNNYLKFYLASAITDVTVGTTIPVLTIPINGLVSTDDVSANCAIPQGIFFSPGLVIAATTGFADNDTGAPGANEVIVNFGVQRG